MKKLLVYSLLLLPLVVSADINVVIPGGGGSGGSGGNASFAATAGTVSSAIAGGALSQMNTAIGASGSGVSNALQSQITIMGTNGFDPVARDVSALLPKSGGTMTGDLDFQTAIGFHHDTNPLRDWRMQSSASGNHDIVLTSLGGTWTIPYATGNYTVLADTGSANNLTGCPPGADPSGAAASVLAQLPAIATSASNALTVATNAQSIATNAAARSVAASTNATAALAASAIAAANKGMTNSSVTYAAAVAFTGVVGWATHNLWISTAAGDVTVTLTNLAAGTLYNVYMPAGAAQRTITLVLQPAGTEYYYGGANNNVWTVPLGACGSTTIQMSPVGVYNISRATGVAR